ncbi:S8 family serine peptidase [Angustibacter aerolatus]
MAHHPPARNRTRPDRVGSTDLDGGYLFRPRQLLVDRGGRDVLHAADVGATPERHAETNHRFAGHDADVEVWHVGGGGVDLPALARELKAQAARAGSWVSPNYVLTGEPLYQGGPGSDPERCDALELPGGGYPSAPALAVLDTGLAAKVDPQVRASVLGLDDADVDPLDEDHDDYLDAEAGHGTFIAGLVQRVAPGLATEQQRVLDSDGFGDDTSIALGLLSTSAPVVNLSLGGYTRQDRLPLALARAVAAVTRDRVVVAAAGNNRSSRPFWPAALPSVVAVGAYDPETGRPARFTNYGDWVDVAAPGVGLASSYVHGTWPGSGSEADVEFSGWARWSGTSFAAPLVAAEIARRVVAAGAGADARQVSEAFVAELPEHPDWPGLGGWFEPAASVR